MCFRNGGTLLTSPQLHVPEHNGNLLYSHPKISRLRKKNNTERQVCAVFGVDREANLKCACRSKTNRRHCVFLVKHDSRFSSLLGPRVPAFFVTTTNHLQVAIPVYKKRSIRKCAGGFGDYKVTHSASNKCDCFTTSRCTMTDK
jgi:hypothetical protein